jgi:hypothetical protein
VGGVGLIVRPDQPLDPNLVESVRRNWTASLFKRT